MFLISVTCYAVHLVSLLLRHRQECMLALGALKLDTGAAAM